MPLRVMASRHSAFYTPLLCCLHMLKSEGHDVLYIVLASGQRNIDAVKLLLAAGGRVENPEP